MTKCKKYGILLLILLQAIAWSAKAQKIQVSIQYVVSSETNPDKFPREETTADSMSVQNLLSNRLQQLYSRGYLAAFYETGHAPEGKLSVLFYTGKKYRLARLGPGDLDGDMLRRIGYKEKFYRNKPFSYPEIAGLLEKILDFSENNGYPFASVKLDSLQIQEEDIAATLVFQSGPAIAFDSLKITGDADLKSKFLMAYLGIYQNKPYNQKLVDEAPKKIAALEYVQLVSPPEVVFRQGKANVELELKRRKSNQVDGIIGLLPNGNDGKKMLLTGQAHLDLQNLFSSGKHLTFEWQKLDVNSQLLNIDYGHPNFLRSPLNLGVGFHLLKQDTGFVNRDFLVKASFLPSANTTLAFNSEFQASRLLGTPVDNGPGLAQPVLDFNLNYYGLAYSYNNYNDPAFPTSGFGFALNAMAGQKKIIKNPGLPDGYYKGISPSSAQYKLEVKVKNHWKLRRNWIMLAAINGGYLYGHDLFLNDLFRIGGLNSLRGFNENFFYASQYAVGTLELRTVFSDNSYFMVFYDQGFVRNSISPQLHDFPFGTGAGFDLSTKAGIFSFVLALGKSKERAFGFNFAKIHFGYVNRF